VPHLLTYIETAFDRLQLLAKFASRAKNRRKSRLHCCHGNHIISISSISSGDAGWQQLVMTATEKR